MAWLTEDPITGAAATLTFLPCRALICYLVIHLPKASISPISFLLWYETICAMFTVLKVSQCSVPEQKEMVRNHMKGFRNVCLHRQSSVEQHGEKDAKCCCFIPFILSLVLGKETFSDLLE